MCAVHISSALCVGFVSCVCLELWLIYFVSCVFVLCHANLLCLVSLFCAMCLVYWFCAMRIGSVPCVSGPNRVYYIWSLSRLPVQCLV